LFVLAAEAACAMCLTVVDEFSRECLAVNVADSIRSGRWIEVLAKRVSVHGSPQYLRSDNGPEFVSRAVLMWLLQANINTAHIDPGKPWQNGNNESFPKPEMVRRRPAGQGPDLPLSELAESQGASAPKLRIIQSHVTPAQSEQALAICWCHCNS
jgi:transposase InsO family protein